MSCHAHTRMHAHIHTAFARWARVVYNNQALCLALPVLFTVCASSGFAYLAEQTSFDDKGLYAPKNGRWKKELAVVDDVFPMNTDEFLPGFYFDYPFFTDIIVRRRDGGDILEQWALEEIMDMHRRLVDEISVDYLLPDFEGTFRYRDLCLSYESQCYGNDHLIFVSNWTETFRGDKQYEQKVEVAEREFSRTYPVGRRGNEPLSMGELVGNPTIIDDEGHFSTAEAIRLVYDLRDDMPYKPYSFLWQDKLVARLQAENDNVNATIEYLYNSKSSMLGGLVSASKEFVPYIIVTVVVLIVFSVLCSMRVLRNDIGRVSGFDWALSKPWLAVGGVVISSLAVATTHGILLLCGFMHNEICNLAPFIVISIGVDDMFILSSAWHGSSASKPPIERLSTSLSHAAVSITITSVTDILSFFVGTNTPLDAVNIFCVYCGVGIAFTYLYYMCAFIALMACMGGWESEGRNAACPIVKTVCVGEGRAQRWFNRSIVAPDCEDEKIDIVAWAEDPPLTNGHAKGTNGHAKGINGTVGLGGDHFEIKREEVAEVAKKDRSIALSHVFFRKIYGPFIVHPLTRVAVLLLFVIYAGIALLGVLRLEQGLNPKHLVGDDQPFQPYIEQLSRTFYRQGVQMHVFVKYAPNITDAAQTAELQRMMGEFDDYRGAVNGSMISVVDDWWGLDLYKQPESSAKTYEILDRWVHSSSEASPRWRLSTAFRWTDEIRETGEEGQYPGLVLPTDGTNLNFLTSYRFQFALTNYSSTANNRLVMKDMRRIADRWPQFGVSVYQWYFPFSEQFDIIGGTLFRNVAIALVCMVVVSLVLIPSVAACFLITLAILSIDFGVLGYMSWWSVNLDAISMVSIVMSTGFAVDLTAHISYAFVMASGSPRDRVIGALEAVGWPVVQGGLSTALGMVSVVNVNAYIITTVFKCIFLVIFAGMLHSLVFLPVVLVTVLPLAERIRHKLGIGEK